MAIVYFCSSGKSQLVIFRARILHQRTTRWSQASIQLGKWTDRLSRYRQVWKYPEAIGLTTNHRAVHETTIVIDKVEWFSARFDFILAWNMKLALLAWASCDWTPFFVRADMKTCDAGSYECEDGKRIHCLFWKLFENHSGKILNFILLEQGHAPKHIVLYNEIF